jgi:Bifunctional DNA primase/polymerase, N-terminal/AAA domain
MQNKPKPESVKGASTNLPAAALSYAKHGFKIFPILDGAKFPPLIKQWGVNASSDPKVVERWWTRWSNANIGLACAPSGIAVVDQDEKDGKSGKLTLGELSLADGLDLTPTRRQRTPTGGVHHLYRGTVATTAGKIGPGVDTRGVGSANGGYILLAPSVTKAGPYIWINPANRIASLDQWVADRAGVADSISPVEQEPVVELDQKANIERATLWLKEGAPICRQGAGGDDTLVKRVAPVLKDMGISEELACELAVSSGWNDRCEPPWQLGGDAKDNLYTKMHNGYIFCRDRAPGADTAEADFATDPYEADGATDTPKDGTEGMFPDEPPPEYSDGFTADELEDADLPEEVELIEDLILAEVAQTIDADGGVGKSLVSAQMVVHVSAGEPIFGRKVLQRPALFITHEDRAVRVRERMRWTAKAMKRENGLRGLPLRVVCETDSDLTIANIKDDGTWSKGPYYNKLDSLIEKTGRGAFVVLDCQTDFAQGHFITERPVPNAWYKKILAGLCRKHAATILVICHPSKASMADGSFSEGSTANRTAVRRKIVMKLVSPKNPDGPRWFGLLKNQYGPQGRLMKVVWRDGIFVLDSDPDLTEETVTLYTAIIDKVREMIRAGLVIVKHKQASGHNPESVARAMSEDTPGAGGIRPSPEDVACALEYAERKGLLRYIKNDKNKHIKAHYEIVDATAEAAAAFAEA